MNDKDRTAYVRTELLEEFITMHIQAIGGMLPTQRFLIHDLEMDETGDFITLEGEVIYEETMQ